MTIAPSAPMGAFAGSFATGADALAAALMRLVAEDAVSLPLLDPSARRRLADAAADLPFRPARPVIGTASFRNDAVSSSAMAPQK